MQHRCEVYGVCCSTIFAVRPRHSATEQPGNTPGWFELDWIGTAPDERATFSYRQHFVLGINSHQQYLLHVTFAEAARPFLRNSP